MSGKAEAPIDVDAVRDEHMAQVEPRRQWAYLFAVLVGGVALMLALIALLDALSR